MFDELTQKFLASDVARNVISELKGKGIEGGKAEQAVRATAEGAATSMGGAGVGGALEGMLAGGGKSNKRAAGAGNTNQRATGGGASGAVLDGGAGGGMSEKIVDIVCRKTGLSQDHARMVVDTVLPKVTSYFRKG